MSLEQAILTHAASIDNLAAAIRAALGGQFTPVTDAVGVQNKGTTATPDADLDKAVGKVEGDAKAAQATAMKSVEDKKAAAKAKKDAETKAAAEQQAAADAAAQEAAEADGLDEDDDDDGLSDESPVLDYKADVRPVLLAAIKRTTKEEVQKLIKTYGVDKAEQIDPAKFADVVAKANKLGL